MLNFRGIREMLNRAKVAYDQYISFEKGYKGVKGSIYQQRKKYYYNKLDTYQANLKNYANAGWYVWEGLIEFTNNNSQTIQDRFVICLPKQVNKAEVEALMQFKVIGKDNINNLLVLDVKVIDTFETGKIIFASENSENYFRK